MKRFLTWLFLTLPVLAQAQFTFTTNDDNTLTVTGYTGTNEDIVIPDSTNGYPVASIGTAAFYGFTKITSVTIPNSITHIGMAAFNSCYGLTSVAIPASVTNIEDYAFFYCTNLTAIAVDDANPNYSSADGVLFNKDKTLLMQFPFGKTGSYAIPGSVTRLADEAFGIFPYYLQDPLLYSACPGLTNIIIPGSIVSIGDSAFSHCTGLKNVIISNGVTSIGTNAFSWCLNLSDITIPNSVTNIDGQAFYYSGLTHITIPGSVNNLEPEAFAACSSLTNVIMLDGVTDIGKAEFNFCTNLTSVVFPDSLASIGERAFWFCSSLTNVAIPANVADIGDFAFSGCASLININVSGDNVFYKSVDGVLFDGDQTTLIQFPGGRGGNYRIPGGVFNIGDYAFGSYIPAGSQDAFLFGYPSSCVSLTNLTIPATVTTIGDGAFARLYNLTSIYFEGDAPDGGGDLYGSVAVAYYLPGMNGWETYFQNLPTIPWLPAMQTSDANFGVQTNQFGFNIKWASGQTVVVEASTNLSNPDWQPVQTNTLTTGTAYFSDPQWTNYPNRFYRLRSP